MKRIFAIVILINLFIASGCGLGKVDESEGRNLTERLLKDRKNQEYGNLAQYYVSSFMAHESPEKMIAKYQKLNQTAGPIQDFELISHEQQYDEASGYHQLTLIYKVTCSNVLLRETYIVVNDEGRTGILFQNMENWELKD